MYIKEDDLSSAKVAKLLEEHVASAASLAPPESTHALGIDELRSPGVTFWSAWDSEELLGFGALQELHPGHAEIKSMRTAAAHVGKGVASALLGHILDVARKRGFVRLSLETGSAGEFKPAQALYRKFGFEFCGPFADYVEDPHSRYMTLVL